MRLRATIGMMGMNPSPPEKARAKYLKEHIGLPYLVETLQISGGTKLELKAAQYYFDNPSVIQQELLSCSVISDTHPQTYVSFSFGFILEVPKGNVCAASKRDLAVNNSVARGEMLATLTSTGGKARAVDGFLDILVGMYESDLPAPRNLLADSGNQHNEVVVVGSLGGSAPVKVIGIFVKVTPEKGLKLWESAMKANLLIGRCSQRFNLPIVPIPDDSGTASNYGVFQVFRRKKGTNVAYGFSSLFSGGF